MKSPLNVLIVEDRANHIADCQAMFEEVLPKLPIQVNALWARDLKEATSLLSQADAVMTDVFFPASPDASDEEPNGQKLVEHCLAESKPVVWVTSTHHHGQKTDPVFQWGRARGLQMFDSSHDDWEGESPHKPWKRALYGLFYTVLCVEENQSFYQAKNAAWKFCSDSPLEGEPVLQKMVALGFPRA